MRLGFLIGSSATSQFYCLDNDLPPLTSIVVGKALGKPGSDIPVDLATIEAQREAAYEYDWYDLHPPSRDELLASYEANKK